MRVRGLCVGVLGLAIAAMPVAAQRPGSVEFGLFGQATKFDEALKLNGAFSVGGRFGIFVLPGLALEGDVANGRPIVLAGSPLPATNNDRLSYAPLHLRLAYNMMMGWRGGLILGAGIVRTDYGIPYGFGANGLIGFRVGLMDRVQLRADGLIDYMGKWEPEATTNLSARLGISYIPGPVRRDRVMEEIERPIDIDADGILDNLDECKDTPAGVRVDARGCTVPVDSDGDGVVDAADRCPGTPAGTTVDANGCPPAPAPLAPTDTDGDGVTDIADRCAGTPAGTAVDANGCPADTDRDGVLDSADRCANTPAGTAVNSTGCPLPPPDADGDGVPNDRDRCAETTSGFEVDENGCPRAIKEGVTTVELRGVNFETSSAKLTTESSAVLDAIASFLTTSGQRIEIAGHTDNTGSVRTNDNLSQSRAMSVRSYLISKGVPAAQLIARGYGSKQPVADNTTEDGRMRNRRVELRKM